MVDLLKGKRGRFKLAKAGIEAAEEKALKQQEEIPVTLSDVKRVLEERVGLHVSFDLVLCEMIFGGTRVGIFYCNGFAKDIVLTDIMERLTYAEPETVEGLKVEALQDKLIPHIQVKTYAKMSEIVGQVLMGGTALFVEGESKRLRWTPKAIPFAPLMNRIWNASCVVHETVLWKLCLRTYRSLGEEFATNS